MAHDSFSVSDVIPAPPERIYSAWLDAAAHTAFTGEEATFEPYVGGRHTAFGGYSEGTNLELLPGRRIVQSWRAKDFPEGSPDSRLEVTLEETVGGTVVTILHSELPSGQSERYRDGWVKFYLEPLKTFFSSEDDEDVEDDDDDEEVAPSVSEAESMLAADDDEDDEDVEDDEDDEGGITVESPAPMDSKPAAKPARARPTAKKPAKTVKAAAARKPAKAPVKASGRSVKKAAKKTTKMTSAARRAAAPKGKKPAAAAKARGKAKPKKAAKAAKAAPKKKPGKRK